MGIFGPKIIPIFIFIIFAAIFSLLPPLNAIEHFKNNNLGIYEDGYVGKVFPIQREDFSSDPHHPPEMLGSTA